MPQVPLVDLKAQYATIRKQVQKAFSDALDDMGLVLGPNVRAFETEFAAYCHTDYAVGVGSGTDALYLALRACGIRPYDEVITVDTSVAHLAGALGRPVWILSRYDGCWRWLEDRDDSPWYPTARLFRQRAPAAWDEVIGRVAAALVG